MAIDPMTPEDDIPPPGDLGPADEEAAPLPRCPGCGAFVSPDDQYSPATCPSCGDELPPNPEEKSWRAQHESAVKKAATTSPQLKPKAALTTRPWAKDKRFIAAVAESTAKFTRAAIDIHAKTLIDAYHKSAKAAFDQAVGDLAERISQLETAVESLMAVAGTGKSGETLRERVSRLEAQVGLRVAGAPQEQMIVGKDGGREYFRAGFLVKRIDRFGDVVYESEYLP